MNVVELVNKIRPIPIIAASAEVVRSWRSFCLHAKKGRKFSAHHAIVSNVMHDGTAVAKNLNPEAASIWFRIEKPSPHAMAPPGPAPGSAPWEPQIGPIACGLAFCFWRTLFFLFFFVKMTHLLAFSPPLEWRILKASFAGPECGAK